MPEARLRKSARFGLIPKRALFLLPFTKYLLFLFPCADPGAGCPEV